MSGPRVTTEQARECLVACPIDTILMHDLAADLLDARAEIASLRAALKRCHALLETARDHWAYDDQVEEWRNLVLAELSPCDESGSCPPERRGRGRDRFGR